MTFVNVFGDFVADSPGNLLIASAILPLPGLGYPSAGAAVEQVIRMDDSPGIDQNRLLWAAPEDVRTRLAGHLIPTEMKLGSVVYDYGDIINDVYFPTNSIVSLLAVMADGHSAEISVVGNDGVVGFALFMGGRSTTNRAIVQSEGHAYKLKHRYLEEEFNRYGDFHRLLLRYTQALITQVAQTAVCNRHHSIDQHLCRWLLLALDRLQGDEIIMTQELIANMLGVRREGVTEAAARLQRAGVIHYRRGHITVIDRPRLEELCCECYAVTKRECDRLMGNA